MADLELNITADLSPSETVEVTVFEDTDLDGTAENSATQEIDDGTNSYTLSGFDVSSGNEVWAEIKGTTTDVTASSSIQSLEVKPDIVEPDFSVTLDEVVLRS